MSNEPKLDKAGISIMVPASLKVQVQKMADMMKMSLTDFIMALLVNATANVELTADDYDKIAKQVRKNEERRKSRRNLNLS